MSTTSGDAPQQDWSHQCFICLQTDADPPNGPWVNPCPCSLEAHQNCMLQWIAETEYEAARAIGRRQSPLKCPACKAKIHLEEPHDPVVALYNDFLRRYSRLSPAILLTIVTGGAVAGSAWYGVNAFGIFAGRRAVSRWLGLHSLLGARKDLPSWQTALRHFVKVAELSLIGPVLISLWAVPSSVILSMPASIMYAATLISQEHYPSWPPSPRWAMIALPHVHAGYELFYTRVFGSFEKRLNQALRGRLATDTDAPPQDPGAAPAAQQPANGGRNNNAGAWAILLALGGIVTALFAEPPEPNGDNMAAPEVNRIEIEVDLGGPPEEEAEVEDAGPDVGVEEHGGDLGPFDEELGFEEFVWDVPAEQAEVEQPPPRPAEDIEQPPPRPARANRRPARERRRPNNAANQDNNVEPRISVFSLISNGLATTLLLPVISYCAGELIRAVVPWSWTRVGWSSAPLGMFRRRPGSSPQAPTGLLQLRWGRSLAGACLYYVLRDAFALFYKYRKVQVKKNRRVRNVARKNVDGAAAGTTV